MNETASAVIDGPGSDEAVGDVRPVSWDLHPSADDLRETRRRLAEAGVREFPYPFKTAFAITSDIDRSNRRHFAGYVGQIVRDHGLDFGDSVWLQTNGSQPFQGLGFYDARYQLRDREAIPVLVDEFDHYELVAEYHRGNIDHWHGSLVRGPRFVVLRDVEEAAPGKVRIAIPPVPLERDPYHDAKPFPLCALALISASSSPLKVAALALHTKKGARIDVVLDVDATTEPFANQTGAAVCFLPVPCPMTGPSDIAMLHELRAIEISLARGQATDIREVVALNITTDINLGRIRHLADTWAIVFNLITIHGKWIIPHHVLWKKQRRELTKRLAASGSELVSEYGSGEVGGAAISTMADERFSFARLYPELLESYGTCYWRPSGNCINLMSKVLGDDAFQGSILEAVTPARRRDGGGIVILNTDKGENPHKTGRPAWDRRTMAAHFPSRLRWYLDSMKAGAFEFGIIYTHLGNLHPEDKVKEPYFDENLFERLRRLHYGIAHRTEDGPRLWFTRASVIADFARLLPAMAKHVTRPDPATISISSWQDPLLGLSQPHGVHQLFGQTFYVDDARSARVLLDGEPIHDLLRNPPDETGRPSVTVAVCPIGQTLLRSLPPGRLVTLSAATHLGEANVSWHDSENGDPTFLRVQATGEVPEGVRIDAGAIDPFGFQVLKLVHRRSGGDTRFAIVVHTGDGGRFVFGSPTLAVASDPPTAGYDLDTRTAPDPGDWETSIVPFWDLDWNTTGTEALACPLPTRDVRSIDIVVAGKGSFDIAELSFRRPKTMKNCHGSDVVIGGLLPDRPAGVAMRLERGDGSAAVVQETETDDLGGFVFSRCAPGGYGVTRLDTGETRWVEAFEHRCDIEFAAPAGMRVTPPGSSWKDGLDRAFERIKHRAAASPALRRLVARLRRLS
jgi:hypothetical protein